MSFSGRAFLWSLIASGLLLAFGAPQTASAQNVTNQLKPSNNYIVTGDYVVGGVGLRGLGDATGFAKGTIRIPDTNSVPATGVPAGADIVAAFLYWETVESTAPGSRTGKQGFFNTDANGNGGYPITGDKLGNPNTPMPLGLLGCSCSLLGTRTLATYRADVRPFLNVDANGRILGNGAYGVRLADSGGFFHDSDDPDDGSRLPVALGASLVLVYRVLSPAMPLNSIIIYDGGVAPSNSSSTFSQDLQFYQAAKAPVAKITYIVGDGRPLKGETVLLNGVGLPSLYGNGHLPPFPGIYKQNAISPYGGGSWDSPTWLPNSYGAAVLENSAVATTQVIPGYFGCVDWGAVIFSTTVKDTDGDGLLDVWETNQGYTDILTNQFVALPGANPNVKDIFFEVDYLTNLDGSAGPYLHSHLPKQAALDKVGDAFKNAPVDCDPVTKVCKGIRVHFDVGNSYQTAAGGGPALDPYIVPAGTGGNAISESAVICNDSGTGLCQFPSTPTIGWKESFLAVKNNSTLSDNVNVPLGNFQPGRKDSYHYVLFGHAFGGPRSFWTAFGTTVQNPTLAKLISIVDSGNTATVTIQSPPPPGLVKPGDCPNPAVPACSDANASRITIAGALGQPALNGTYSPFTVLSSSVDANQVTTTKFSITTSGVTDGTYNFSNEPRLEVLYLGPTSSSGHSDLGGADSEITFGLWPADDPVTSPFCQGDPSQPLQPGQVYCNSQLGTVLQQAGTLMHELGHTLTLTHGGTYYSPSNVATYESNCKPNYLSVMSYLFQVRGFPENGMIDYSGQTLQPLDETQLNESTGIGSDIFTGAPAMHLTRWYAPPNAIDLKVGRFATAHCDGTPVGPTEPPSVRVDGTAAPTPPVPAIDWNHDLIAPDTSAWQDVNFLGTTQALPASPFQGFNDWTHIDLHQVGARENALGYSDGTGAGAKPQAIGGGTSFQAIGGGTSFQAIGGGTAFQAIGGGTNFQAIGGGTGFQGLGSFFLAIGGDFELQVDTVNSVAEAPPGLTCTIAQGAASGCVASSPILFTEQGQNVPLTWAPPTDALGQVLGQIRAYDIWSAPGSFPTLQDVLNNRSLFTDVKTLSGAPPATMFAIPAANNNTYTYFVTETNQQGVQSGPSAPIVVKAEGVTTTAITALPASPVFGQQVTLTATVSASGAIPTGTVTFSDGPITSVLGTITLDGTGTAILQTSSLTVGGHSFTASYSGDPNFLSSASSATPLTVSQASATTVLTISPVNAAFNQPLTLTATIGVVTPGAGTPTGSVTFADGATALSSANLSGGQASITISAPSAGSHSFNATYSGDSNFTGSSLAAPVVQIIVQAAATVTLGNLSPMYDGTPKTATATTTPPGLAVTFTYNGSPTAPTSAGTYAVIATINDTNYQGSVGGMFTISKRVASATPAGATKVFGTADPAVGGTLAGFVPADGVTATYTRTPGETVAGSPYTISATLSPANVLSNYAIVFNTAAFTITQASANVTFSNLTQPFAGKPLSPTVTTAPAGLAFTLTGAPDTNAGSYPVMATVTDPNYTGSASSTFVITLPAASVSPSSVDFGLVRAGTVVTKTVTLTNTGNALMTIASIKISGSDTDEFSASSKCSSTLAAGANCTISVTYYSDKDDTAGVTATLLITDNAPGSPQAVPLKGQTK